MPLILASNSPRRKQLLKDFGFDFVVKPSSYEENLICQTPEQTVKNFALGKAMDVFNSLTEVEKKVSVVLGADTVVSFNGEILGKPKSIEEARQMLKNLSGEEHQVYTGYCFIYGDKVECFSEKTTVRFNTLTDSLIEEYIATGKPMDKAGAYGIQDGFNLAKDYDGSFNNIVGLPVEIFKDKLNQILKEK